MQPPQPARSTAPELPAQFAGYRAGWLVSQIYDLQPDVLNPNDYRLSLYFNAYIRAFDQLCEQFLPADHVLYEPTYMAYDRTEYGLAFNTHVYKETVAESTRMRKEYLPIYADAKQGWMRKLIDMDIADDIKTFVDVMPFLVPGGMLWNDATDAKEDTERVLTVERCDSAFTQRFERNLFRAIVDPAKHAPGTIQASAGVGGAGTTLSHRNVEKGFVPPIPEPLPPLPLTLSIDTPPPGNHLVRVQLLNAAVAPFDPRMTADRLPAAEKQNFQADFAQARQEGQLVLTCRYATPDGLTRTFAYWYKTLAPVVADEARLRGRASDHPMLRVRETRSVCAGTQP